MHGKFVFLLAAVLLGGCATYHPSVPEDYRGATSVIEDTETRIDDGKADLFYLTHVNGNRVKNSRSETQSWSYGQGNLLTTVLITHPVAATEQTFSIIGRTIYAMPARALASTVYEVKGDVTFVPEPDVTYLIRGELTDERSSVWLERSDTGEVVETIEVEGSTSLGIFQK